MEGAAGDVGAEDHVAAAQGPPVPLTDATGAPTDPGMTGAMLSGGVQMPPGAQGSPGGKKKGRNDGPDGVPDGADGSAPQGPVSNPLALRHERLQGTVSKYVPASGWGFVKSHLFEGELGFKTESIMPECQSYEFQEGEGVEFDVQSDERGRAHAVALKPIVGRKPTECLGQRYRGYVRRFADRWGFLNAAAFDGDLFVHRDNLLLGPEQLQGQDGQPPLRAGQAVEFDVALDDRGRTVAKQITTSALLRPCDWIGRRLQGYVRSFQGAWGFLNSDRFAGDLFVHRDSLLAQYQGVELTVGAMVEFDVERDHHKKGGKNRLVARQVAVLSQPSVAAQPGAYQMQNQQMLGQGQYGGHPGIDPMVYSTVPPVQQPLAAYGSTLNPQAASFAPLQTGPYIYGAAPMPGIHDAGAPPVAPDPQGGQVSYGQHPYQYPPEAHYPQQQVLPPQQMVPPMQQSVVSPGHYGQQMMVPGTQPAAYGQPPLPPQPQIPQAPMAQSPYAQSPYPQPPYGQLPPYGQPQYGQLPYVQPITSTAPQQALPPQQQLTPNGMAPGQGTPDAAAAQLAARFALSEAQAQAQAQMAAMQPTATAAGTPQGMHQPEPVQQQMAAEAVQAAQAQPASPDGQQQVLLHITTHDWEPDQAGQLRVKKGTLVNVSHRAAHGWVYAATVQPIQPGDPSEPQAEGWVPQAVAKKVSLARVVIDWPPEGSGTLGLAKGDLIAVSKEAERGWVYGERVSPKRPDWAPDGWLPKKVLEYIVL